MSENSKIDFVIPWVDSEDPSWLESYKETFPNKKIDKNRFTDTGLLKYWFRAVEQYAPWVNRIHFITQGHLPDFLDVNHPKINIVKHEDYIPEKYLPTFSSHPIELNLHRIEDMAEKFVYFNDDMYLVNDVQPTFFFKNNLPRNAAILRPVVSPNYYHISEVHQNNNGVINQNFDFKYSFRKNIRKWVDFKYGLFIFSNLLFSNFNHLVGFNQDHMPNSFLKSTFVEVWSKEYEILDMTSSHKLRNIKTDVNQWLFEQWQMMSGSFYPRSLKHGKLFTVETLEDILEVEKSFNNKKLKYICVNDHILDSESHEEITSKLDLIFSKELSDKSKFEK